jgi:DNA uptake protein ComE-like DNA-binding protein
MTRLDPLPAFAAALLFVASAAVSRQAMPSELFAVEPAGVPDARAQSALVDPNQATRAQLLAIPGLTAARADALVKGRPYANMLAVDSVLVAGGLSEEQRDAVYAKLWKPLDLNTASDAEILLIPGVGNRMLREFREYRPYRTLAQFSREMGKYVDDAEVTRLEQYVRVP